MQRTPKGGLELTWIGKDMALIPAAEGEYSYAWADRGDPRALEGDSYRTRHLATAGKED
jgi:hypothetical protein